MLWTIGLMGLLVMSFAFDAHLESKLISHYRKRTRAGTLAQSGIEIAKLVLAKTPRVDPRARPDPSSDDPWLEPARQLAASGALHQSYPLGDGEVQLDIVTEQARRSVNTLKREEDWEPILDVIGLPEEDWPALIDAFLDWTDADDTARANGAETDDYYKTLEPPYRARNGDLFAVEELLLIKGFNRAIMVGGPLDPEDEKSAVIAEGGLSRLLTVFGDQKVNVNAAPFEVLLTLPSARGDNDLLAEDILEERTSISNLSGAVEDKFFLDDGDMFRRLPALGEAERKEYVTATPSSKYYRITATGRVQNVIRTVWCIVQNEGGVLTFLRWVEED